MQVQPLFKGLTRPAMFFGVPIMPLFASIGVVMLLAFYTQQFFLLFVAIPMFFILRLMTKKDDFIFRFYFLKMQFFTNPLSKKFHKSKTYSSQNYARPLKENFKRENIKLSIVNLQSEPNFEKLLPYSTAIADGVVITKEHLLMSTFKIDGIAFEVEDDNELDAKNNLQNMIYKTFANEPVSFYFHNARYKTEEKLHAKFENSYLQELNDRYYQGFSGESLFKNSLFLTIIYNPITRLEKSMFSKKSIKQKEELFKQYLKKHNEYVARLDSSLSVFNATLLKNYEIKGNLYSKQLEFYNFLIGGRFMPVRVLKAPIYSYLTGGVEQIYFGNDTGQIHYSDGKDKFFRIVEFKDYSKETFAGILDGLMYANFEYTMTQSYQPLAMIDAKAALSKQRKQLIASEDDAVSQIIELDEALDNLISGEIGFGKYHFSLCVFGDSFEDCRKNTNQMMTALNNLGFMAKMASIALPAAYFSSFPSNFTIRPRINLLSSVNFSSLVALHNFSFGKKDKNCWGEAVCLLKTPNKSPYYLNFHQSDGANKDDFGKLLLANSLILGQSGGGKTVFMNFTFNQMQKYADKNSFPESIPLDKRKMTSIYLDKDYGAKGNILAAGGRYIEIKNGMNTNFNPFMVENTPENLRALKALMALLVTRKGEKLNAKEEKQLSDAVEFIMNEFEKDERKFPISLMLENLTENVNDDNSLKSRLISFKKGKQFGWVFDNESDCLDFPDEINIYGIDGTEFLDDKDVNGILSYFILWRVMSLADGRRFVLDIDEAWKWLENEIVAEEVKNKFKTIRKQNGFLRLATQSVEDFLKLSIAKTLIEQSATKIFLPNPLAQYNDYVHGLNLSEDEYQIIRDFIPTNRQFLVKRQEEKVIATLDLSTLGKENLMILSTGSAYIDTVDRVFSQENKNIDEKINELKAIYKTA